MEPRYIWSTAERNVINEVVMSSKLFSKIGLFRPRTGLHRYISEEGKRFLTMIDESSEPSEKAEPESKQEKSGKGEDSPKNLELCYIQYQKENFESFFAFAAGIFDRVTGLGALYSTLSGDRHPFVGNDLVGWHGESFTRMKPGHILVNPAVQGLKPLDEYLPIDVLDGGDVVVKGGAVYVSSRSGLSHLRFLRRVLRSGRFSNIMTVLRDGDHVLLCRIDGCTAPDVVLTEDELRDMKYRFVQPESILFRHHKDLMIAMHEKKSSNTNITI